MMCLISVMMRLRMAFCVFGVIVEAILIEIVFLFRKWEVFAFFYYDVVLTIIY